MDIMMLIATAAKFLFLLSHGTVVYSLFGPPCMSSLGLEYATSLTFDLAVSSGQADDIRLNGPAAWSPPNISGSFIEINISQPVLLTAFQVQGDPQYTGQITGWLLDTSFDCESYQTENYSLDQVSPVHTQTVYMKSMEFVSCIRIRPTHFKGKVPALRLDLLGCVLQDTSMCDRDVHPTAEIWMEGGGCQLNFAHEIVLSWIKILLDLHAHGDSGDTGIFYSRSCEQWNYYEPSDTSVISVTSSDEKSSWMTIDLDKPVRAKCLRIFPPMASTLREVHTSGCNSHLISGIRELMQNTKMNAYGKESMLQDITAYQKDAPHVFHDTESTSKDDRSVKNKLPLIHEKEKSTVSPVINTVQEILLLKHADASKAGSAGDISPKETELENINMAAKTLFTPVAMTTTSATFEMTTAAAVQNMKETITAAAQNVNEITTAAAQVKETITAAAPNVKETITTSAAQKMKETITTTALPSQKLSPGESATVTLTTILYNSEGEDKNNGNTSLPVIVQDVHLDMFNHSTIQEHEMRLEVNSVDKNWSSENMTITDVVTNERQTTDITNKQQIAEENFTGSNVIRGDGTNQNSTIESYIFEFGDKNGDKNEKYEEPTDGTLEVNYTVQQPDSTSSTHHLNLGRLVSNESQNSVSNSTDQIQTECGKKGWTQWLRKKRVISGNINYPGEWPWLVSMHYLPEFEFTKRSGFKHTCGASLIAPNWILTAAHCFSDVMENGLSNLTAWEIYFGLHDLARKDDQKFVQKRLIEAVYSYPEYDIVPEPLIHDIALVKLNESVEYNEKVSPICLDDTDLYYEENECFVSGWGQITLISPGSQYPHSAPLSIMTLSKCKNKYDILPADHPVKPVIRIVPPVLCATVGTNGEDACQGDSGGPLMCERDGHWHQAGIVAAGYLCGHEATPALYTRVSYFMDWIRDTMELSDDS